MANRLGRALRYMTDAVDYAAVPFRAKRGSPLWSSALSSMAGRGGLSQADTIDTDAAMRLAITSAWAFSAIRLKADRIASADAWPVAKKRVGEKLVNIDNHPFEQLLRQPNSLMTTDFLLSYMTWWVNLLGNGYLFISTYSPGVGKPEEIWPLPANLVTPRPDTLRRSRLTGGQCIDYEYRIGGKTFMLPGENIIHIREPNPFDYWNGLSPLSAAIMGLKIDRGEEEFVYAHYTEDNAVPPSIISLPAETNPVDFDTTKELIRDQWAGKKRTAIVRAGDVSIQMIQQTLEQMQHIETRKFNRDQIFLVYGVPEGMLTGGVSGDSRLATEIAFTRNTIQPFTNRVASELTANLAPYYGSDIEIVAPVIIPQDRSLKIQEYSTYSQDRTINENREQLNLPPIDIVDLIKTLNKERKKLGLDEVELEDASVLLMLNIPIRLHPFISSNTFKAATPPAYANVPQPEEVGDLPGMWGPDNYTSDQAVRAAVALGMTTELRRWEKVALKEVLHGRDPAARSFTSPVLPDDRIVDITRQLKGADEAAVKAVFAREIAWIDDSSRVSDLQDSGRDNRGEDLDC